MSLHRDLQIRDDLHVEVISESEVFFIGESEGYRLSSPHIGTILGALAGGATRTAVVDRLAGVLSPARVHRALDRLLGSGHVVAHAPAIQPAVQVTAVGLEDGASFASLLRQSGIATAPGGLRIVLTDDHRRPALADLNRARLQDGSPWLIVRPTGRTPWLGPLLTPGQGACWRCLAERLSWNPRTESHLRSLPGRAGKIWPAKDRIPGTEAAAAGLIAAEVVALAQTGESRLSDAIVALSLRTLQLEHHPITRRPQCPDCGDPTLVGVRQRQPMRLGNAPVDPTTPGGLRSQKASATVARLRPHLSNITGVVEALRSITVPGVSEAEAPLVFAGRPHARSGTTRSGMPELFRQANLGKGATPEQAHASGMCEAIERYAAVFQGDEAIIRSAPGETGRREVLPEAILCFSAAQYADRNAWNARHPNIAHHVPPPRPPEALLDWAPVWSLTRSEPALAPAALCYFRFPDPPAWGRADSNGLAAGNTLEEAVLQGLLELIERDGVAMWWYPRLQRPRLPIDALDSPFLQRVSAMHRRRDRQLWLLDLSNDLGVSIVAAVSASSGARILYGFGAHLDPRIAAERAVTEQLQLLPMLAAFEAGRLSPKSELARWLREATLEAHPHLTPLGEQAPPSPTPLAGIGAAAQDCVDRLERAGVEVFALDVTRPDIPLSVARVIAPGLHHFWPRLGPGRLYTVPVQLGWCAALSEAQLNPEPVLF